MSRSDVQVADSTATRTRDAAQHRIQHFVCIDVTRPVAPGLTLLYQDDIKDPYALEACDHEVAACGPNGTIMPDAASEVENPSGPAYRVRVDSMHSGIDTPLPGHDSSPSSTSISEHPTRKSAPHTRVSSRATVESTAGVALSRSSVERAPARISWRDESISRERHCTARAVHYREGDDVVPQNRTTRE
jgi:hypothetical protein